MFLGVLLYLPHFYLRSIWSNDLEHVLHVVLCTGMIFLPTLNSINLCDPDL